MVEKCRKIQQIYYALLWALIAEITRRNSKVLGWAQVSIQGLVNFVTAVAYHFCINFPVAFLQPENGNLAHPCIICLHLRIMLLGKSSDHSQSAAQWSDKKSEREREREREREQSTFRQFFSSEGHYCFDSSPCPHSGGHEMLAHIQCGARKCMFEFPPSSHPLI